MDKLFEFSLDERVTITASAESGVVIGRAQYKNAENAYLVRYKAADGRAVQQWWDQSALIRAS